MEVEHTLTQEELQRHDGERNRRKFVACEGIVYDVTDCPEWRLPMRAGLRWPGQDLTSEIPLAPHGTEVFQRPCVRFVGRLTQAL